MLVDEKDLTNLTDLLFGDTAKQPNTKKLIERKEAEDLVGYTPKTDYNLSELRHPARREMFSVGKKPSTFDLNSLNDSYEMNYRATMALKRAPDSSSDLDVFNGAHRSTYHKYTSSDRKRRENENKANKLDRLVTKPKER